MLGIEYKRPPASPDFHPKKSKPPKQRGPKPGWYALSVNKIRHYTKKYNYFLRFEPVDMVGYTTHIYRIGLEEANRVRSMLGLAVLKPQHQRAEQ
jgi:hypothetical protein